MIITHKLQPMDLASRGVPQRVDVMQDDKYSRNLQISLYENGSRWQIPRDVVAVIRYKKSDGTGGNYDTLPDGTLAYDISGNVLTVALAPQVCTAPGLVDFAVCLIQAESEITTFAVNIIVQPVPGADIASEEYENLTLRFFFVTQAEYDALPEEEKLAGTYFITDADEGTDTSLSIAGRAADAFAVGERFEKVEEDMKTSGVQADWTVNNETDPAYIKNRPFYAGDPVLTELLPETTLQFEGDDAERMTILPDAPPALIEKMSQNDQTYIVTWDGTEYKVTASPLLGGLLVIGNLAIKAGETFEDTGEPFLLLYDTDSLVVFTNASGTDHTLSVIHADELVHKIPSKFLADDVGNKVPFFDLKAMGMTDVSSMNEIKMLKVDTGELIMAMDKGQIKISFGVDESVIEFGSVIQTILNRGITVGTTIYASAFILNPAKINSLDISPVIVTLIATEDGFHFILKEIGTESTSTTQE